MSRSSEEVLLIVKNVKNKKANGVLYMMGQRMAWMQESKNAFTVSHMYADIRVQKISPDTKEKVQLQVVFHDGGANTFQFANPEGRQAQGKDRESIKELLQQLLPRFRQKVNSELEEKNRILQEDPELFQLYKDLVVSGIVKAEEFWSNHANKIAETSTSNLKQDVGVSAAFLADIKPQTDGCNGLKYNLTADIIESIFRTYPAVKKKHAEYVPDKLTESEFWTRFFQSHYFHRDRINFTSKDLFADCAKTDEEELKEEIIVKTPDDPLMDLTSMDDGTLGDGYGQRSDSQPQGGNLVNTSLIKRFNQHSTMVLKACNKREATPIANGNQSSNGTGDNQSCNSGLNGTTLGNSRPGTPIVNEPPPTKKTKLQDKIKYEDLETDSNTSKGPSLKLTNMDRYLHGPTPITISRYNSSSDIIHACHAVAQEIQGWTPKLNQVLSSNTALNVLGELSPGGILMSGYSQQQLHQIIPPDFQQEITNLYSALCELLRHFWLCFPTSSKLLEDKVVRMRGNLDRFQVVKLNPMKEKIISNHYSISVLSHLEELLTAAYEKYNSWQSRRMKKR